MRLDHNFYLFDRRVAPVNARRNRCVSEVWRNYRLQSIQLMSIFEIVWDDSDFARYASYVAPSR